MVSRLVRACFLASGFIAPSTKVIGEVSVSGLNHRMRSNFGTSGVFGFFDAKAVQRISVFGVNVAVPAIVSIENTGISI